MTSRKLKAEEPQLKFLDNEAKYGHLVTKHLFPIEVWQKMDKLDRELTVKTAHWFKYYIEPILNLPKENEHLKSQFGLIANFLIIEAVIGVPMSKSEERFTDFFQANLNKNSRKKLVQSIQWHQGKDGSLAVNLRELVRRRNDLLHRADLVNLNKKGSIGMIGYGRGGGGKRDGLLTLKLTPEKMYEFTKEAIKSYFLLEPAERKPLQTIKYL